MSPLLDVLLLLLLLTCLSAIDLCYASVSAAVESVNRMTGECDFEWHNSIEGCDVSPYAAFAM